MIFQQGFIRQARPSQQKIGLLRLGETPRDFFVVEYTLNRVGRGMFDKTVTPNLFRFLDGIIIDRKSKRKEIIHTYVYIQLKRRKAYYLVYTIYSAFTPG